MLPRRAKVGVHHAKFLSPIGMMQGNAYRMAAIIASSCRITYQALQQILVEAESSCEESSVENGEERSCGVEVQRSCQPSAAGLLHAAARYAAYRTSNLSIGRSCRYLGFLAWCTGSDVSVLARTDLQRYFP
jgi:hypothetical protein